MIKYSEIVFKQVNVYEAKTQFSKLLEQVAAGNEIVIARYGRPVARLVPLQRTPVPEVPSAREGEALPASHLDEPDELVEGTPAVSVVPVQADRL